MPQLGLLEGLDMGAKAETERQAPVLRAEMSAPWPPMLNPVMDLLFLSTGKQVETISGSSSLMQVNIWKCFLVASLVALTQQLAELPASQSSSILSMPVLRGLVSGKIIAILCFLACLANPDLAGTLSLVQVSPARKQRAGQGFPRCPLMSASGRQMPKVMKPLTASLQCSTVWYSPSQSLTLLVTLILGRLTSGAWEILTIPLRQAPLCSSSTHSLTFSRPSNSWVTQASMGHSPVADLLTSLGTSSKLFHPPKAVPSHFLPVTNWKERVAISLPASATPMTQLCPKPLWAASRAWRMMAVLPVASKVQLTPHFSFSSRKAFPSFSGVGLQQTSAPNLRATSNLFSLRSMAQILEAPLILAPWMTESPTAPNPHTATVLPGSMSQLLRTAPQPVATPQPIMQTLLRSASGLIFATEISATTVYSLKVEQPMKWQMGLPSSVEKRVVSSGISPLPCVLRMLGQRLVVGCWQQMQVCFMHCGVQQGMTTSPTATRVTPAPILSTTPVAQ